LFLVLAAYYALTGAVGTLTVDGRMNLFLKAFEIVFLAAAVAEVRKARLQRRTTSERVSPASGAE
jgi:hypothetical protein